MATLQFDASKFATSSLMNPIPQGKYVVEIVDSELKRTKSGSGRYLQLALEVSEGEMSGRLLWSRLNVENTRATTVRLAHEELAAICLAVGVNRFADSSELHGRNMIVDVTRQRRPRSDEFYNVIKGYESIKA